MIIKNYEISKNIANFSKNNFYLLYGENFGLKKDIKEIIKSSIKKDKNNVEIIQIYENEITENEENFYNLAYSGSLFGDKKIIIISEASDKIIEKIINVHEKNIKDIFFILFAENLDKKSKLRKHFENDNNSICIPCYPDNERDLINVATIELKKNNISLSREALNILVEKSNSDRNNLRNEIEKIISFASNKKKIELDELSSLINFSGDYRSETLVNECLCGNTQQYKKIVSELYTNTISQILLLRILANKVQRLLKIKGQETNSNNIESIINNLRPLIFWKEKPLIKKQLSIWSLKDLKKIIIKINSIELLCKKNPNASKAIFFGFFLEICTKANNFS